MPQNQLYALLLTLSAVLSWIILAYSCRMRTSPGAFGLIIYTGATMWWAITYAVHWLFFAQMENFLWLDLTYLGVVGVPVGFLIFSASITNRATWLIPRRSYLLFIEPIITIILLFTDPYHGLFFGGNRQSGSDVILSGGIWYRVNVFYLYVLIALALLFLIQSYFKSGPLQKRQIGIILGGSCIALITNIMVLQRFNPFPDLDLTPMAFSLTSLVYAYGLFIYGILDIIPVARNLVIETMADGVLVVDSNFRIVDVNYAFIQLLSLQSFEPRGQKISQILPGWEELIKKNNSGQNIKETLQIHPEGLQFVELHMTSLSNKNDKPTGYVIVIRDISERVNAENQLKRSNVLLNIQLEKVAEMQEQLREQANRDPLTGLYNRRFLDFALSQEILDAEQKGEEVSIIFCDIDHFKIINDQFGHLVGDAVLQSIANILLSTIREDDIACRMGGDEFIIVLPRTTIQVAENRALELIQRISNYDFSSPDIKPCIQLSVGVVCYPQHGADRDELFRAADVALYQAKSRGRNQVVVFQPGD
jgi:diguanylate cyclase (GGDEF)-like protein/PAS domain S-box-containing protein